MLLGTAAFCFVDGPLAASSALSSFSLPTYLWAGHPGILRGVETDYPTYCDPLPRQAPCGLPACQQLLRDARQQVGFYKSLHCRATLREAKLKEQLAHCQAAWEARL